MARTHKRVEIARVGTFELSSGLHTFTPEELHSAARNHATGAAPRIGIGHVDERFRASADDGEPALGSIHNLHVYPDERGVDVLYGDWVDVPDWFDNAMERAYPGRSLEGSAKDGDLRLTGVRLLGYTRPGIHTLADLRSFVANGPELDEAALVASGPDNDGHTFTVLLTAASPAPHAQEAATMDVDRTLLARRLGLADDATDEQIREALSAPVEPAREPEARTEPEPAAEATPAVTPEPAAEPVAAAARLPPGVTVIDDETLATLRAGAATAVELAAAAARRDRDETITRAIGEGRFAPGRRDHYERAWDNDPDGTRSLLTASAADGGLAPGTIPLDPVSSAEEITAGAVDDAAYKNYVEAHFGLEV